jgi:beta-glucanase (GH16 family)
MKYLITSGLVFFTAVNQPIFSQLPNTINSGYGDVPAWVDTFDNDVVSGTKWFNSPPPNSCFGFDQLAIRLPSNVVYDLTEKSVKLFTKYEATQINQYLCNYNPPTTISYNYSTGMLLSKEIFKYGYFEIECRFDDLPDGDVVAPNFWLLGGPNGVYSEIDVFEMKPCRNTDIPMCMFYSEPNNDNRYTPIRNHSQYCGTSFSNPWYTACSVNSNLFNDTYHKYAVEWLPDRLNYYFDNILINTVTTLVRGSLTLELKDAVGFGGNGGTANLPNLLLNEAKGIPIILDVNLNYLQNVWYTERPYCPSAIKNSIPIDDIQIQGTIAYIMLSHDFVNPPVHVAFTDIDVTNGGLNTATGINTTTYPVNNYSHNPPSITVNLLSPTGTWNHTGRAILDDGITPCNNGNNWICQEVNASHPQSLPTLGNNYKYEITSVKVYQLTYDCTKDYKPCGWSGYDRTVNKTTNLPDPDVNCTSGFILPNSDPSYSYRAIDYIQLNDGFDSNEAELYLDNTPCHN